jgi:hypothetical protein
MHLERCKSAQVAESPILTCCHEGQMRSSDVCNKHRSMMYDRWPLMLNAGSLAAFEIGQCNPPERCGDVPGSHQRCHQQDWKVSILQRGPQGELTMHTSLVT